MRDSSAPEPHPDGPRRERRRRRRRGRHAAPPRRGAFLASLGLCLAVGSVGSVFVTDATRATEPAAASSPAAEAPAGLVRELPPDEASRSGREAQPSPGASPSASPAAPVAAAAPPASPPPPARARPVAGLDQSQTDNAAAIIAAGRRAGAPERAMVVAIATALQESTLRNLANTRVPASLNLPHQGTGSDHDSLGLFQQRPSQNWGTVTQIMDPAYSARVFYERLLKVPNWQNLSIAGAAQAVQRSALPDAYAKHEQRARQIVDALT